MTQLQKLLIQIPQLLEPSGRIAAVTFHSLEDRIVKRFLKSMAGKGFDSSALQISLKESPVFRLVTKRVIIAQEEELTRNPRSR